MHAISPTFESSRPLGLGLRTHTNELLALALIDALVRFRGEPDTITYHAPPFISREQLERGGYIASFPDLAGSVSVFDGDERDHAEFMSDVQPFERWSEHTSHSDVMLLPAACHSIYPIIADSTVTSRQTWSLLGQCYRHEPSPDPMRMRYFRMYERVLIGTSSEAKQHAEAWLEHGRKFLQSLGLQTQSATAHDPFFGKAGDLVSSYQLERGAKVEALWSRADENDAVALMSVNRHDDHFGTAYAISTPGGGAAHSACAAFGIDRIILALHGCHGDDLKDWPTTLTEGIRSE